MVNHGIKSLKNLIASYPRIKLLPSPTPVYIMENLTSELGGPEIYVKRDDLTGLAFGGNKSRKLEFILADARTRGFKTVVTWGSLQSNWCLQLATASSKIGLKPVLVLFKSYDLPFAYEGNVFLEKLLGAEVVFKDSPIRGKSPDQELAFKILEELISANEKSWPRPYLVSVGGSATGGHMDRALGALAYLNAMVELVEQLGEEDMPDYVVLATGSGATQSGLLVGAKVLGLKTRVIGICVSDRKDEFYQVVEKISVELVRMLELNIKLDERDILLFDEYLGPGYGCVTEEISTTIREVFKKEGVVLDPVYTGKAMFGLLDLVKKGHFSTQEKVLFLHTGGTPALFAFKDRILNYLRE